MKKYFIPTLGQLACIVLVTCSIFFTAFSPARSNDYINNPFLDAERDMEENMSRMFPTNQDLREWHEKENTDYEIQKLKEQLDRLEHEKD